MAQSYGDSQLIPALITALQGVTVTAGDNESVVGVELWDAYRRDTTYLVHILVRTRRQEYTDAGCDWQVTRVIEFVCTVAQDALGEKRTDEILGDLAFDVVTTLSTIDRDSADNAYKASMGSPLVTWFQDIDADIQDVGVSIEIPYRWTEDKATGAITGPAV